MDRILVRVSAGPTWDGGHIRDQPGWDEHALFVDALIDEGTFLMGGPLADNSGSIMLFRGLSRDQVGDVLESDPFVENGVFVVEEILAWSTIVDPFEP